MAKNVNGINSTSLNLGTFFDPVQPAIKLVEERMLQQADQNHQELAAALNHLLASGGKRIRVAVTLLMGRLIQANIHDDALSQKFERRLITLAASIEMLHTATLVHDDLIDGALVRRGIPTLNAQWTPAATVLTGDFVFARAARLAAETDSVAVMRLFADTLATIVGGEIRQLFGRRSSSSREDYEKRIYAKTASLFETATLATAYLCEDDSGNCSYVDFDFATIKEITQAFGFNLGMAFQIVDDILDFTGEQALVGKPVASDLRQGLFTLPAIVFKEHNPNDPDLCALLDDVSPSEINFDRLLSKIKQDLLDSNGTAIDLAMKEAQKYIDEAVSALGPLPDSIEKRSLIELAGFITNRKN